MNLFDKLAPYPGGDLVAKGIDDLAEGMETNEAILVSIARTRLRDLGFILAPMKDIHGDYELSLYHRLQPTEGDAAHAAYNALVQRLDSFISAYSRIANRA